MKEHIKEFSMKYSALIITAITLSGAIAFAQDAEQPGRPGKRQTEGRDRANMQERMKKNGGPEGKEGDRRGGREEMIERMLDRPETREKLGISEADFEAIKSELDKLKTEDSRLKEKMQKLGLEQAKVMTSKELDEDKLMGLVEDIGRVRTDLAKARMRKMLIIRKHIDPEKMRAIRQKLQSRMRSRDNKSGAENGEGDNSRVRDRRSRDDKAGFEQMRKKRQAREKDAERKPADSLEVM